MTEHRKRIMAKREAVHAAGPGRVTFRGPAGNKRIVFEPRSQYARLVGPSKYTPHQGPQECARIG